MAKVTSKLQVTIPKAVADRFGIRPGDEVDWVAAGDAIRVLPKGSRACAFDVATRLALFDAATARQRARESERPAASTPGAQRGWTREDLYDRG